MFWSADAAPFPPDRLGKATIDPFGEFPAGFVGSWRITVIVGEHGVDDGGSLFIARRLVSDAPHWQATDPAAPNYCSVTTTGAASLRLTYEPSHGVRPWRGGLVLRVFDGSLAPGDRVTFVLGDTAGGSAGIRLQSYPEKPMRFMIFVDAFGAGEYYALPDPPSLTITPGSPAHVEAIVPSYAGIGESVAVYARVCDAWFNPLDDFTSDVVIDSDSSAENLPIQATISRGVERVGTFVPQSSGVYRLRVRAGPLTGTSNPLVVGDGVRRLFWADMHGQTEETVGSGTIADYFAFARDKGLIDVAAWQGNDFQVTDATWREVRDQTLAFHQPDRFVTFLGYEWSGLTPAGGDHNILFRHDDGPLHRSSHWQIHDGSDTSTDRYPIARLWQEFESRDDVIAIPHVGGRHADLAQSDPNLCPLVEIHSHHGTFEWMAADAFARGLVAGFCAQSDDHFGRPGLTGPSLPMPGEFVSFDVFGGLTAIAAPDLRRDALWQAIRQRHCYATTGARIVLSVETADERQMGDLVTTVAWPLRVGVAGTAPLLDVQVLRDMDVVYRHSVESDHDPEWIRVEWSGVRVKGRRKKARWDGRIAFDGGQIDEFVPYAYDRPGDAAILNETDSIVIHATTSGDPDGVFIRVPRGCQTFHLKLGPVDEHLEVGDLDHQPRRFPAGGVNLEVRVSRGRPEGRSTDRTFEWTDSEPPDRPCAYWIRVLQMDGHMAWSSPIYARSDAVPDPDRPARE
jgi:hypothetical protein